MDIFDLTLYEALVLLAGSWFGWAAFVSSIVETLKTDPGSLANGSRIESVIGKWLHDTLSPAQRQLVVNTAQAVPPLLAAALLVILPPETWIELDPVWEWVLIIVGVFGSVLGVQQELYIRRRQSTSAPATPPIINIPGAAFGAAAQTNEGQDAIVQYLRKMGYSSDDVEAALKRIMAGG